MSEAVVTLWLLLITGFDLLAVCVAIFVLFPAATDWHWQLKWGIALGVAGLVVQVTRTLYFTEHGVYPLDVWFPQWSLKDVGLTLLIYYFTFTHPKETPT